MINAHAMSIKRIEQIYAKLAKDPLSAACEFEKLAGELRCYNKVKVNVVAPDGSIKQTVEDHNIMNSFGLNRLCELVATGGEASGWVSAGRIGTSTTAAASNDASCIASVASRYRTLQKKYGKKETE